MALGEAAKPSRLGRAIQAAGLRAGGRRVCEIRLSFAPRSGSRKARSGSAQPKLEHRRLCLVVDCLNTKLPKSLNVVLHGLERFGGVPLPIRDFTRHP